MINKIPVYSSNFCFSYPSLLFFYRFVPLSCCCFRSLHHALLLLLAHSSVFLCLCLSCRPNPSLLFRLSLYFSLSLCYYIYLCRCFSAHLYIWCMPSCLYGIPFLCLTLHCLAMYLSVSASVRLFLFPMYRAASAAAAAVDPAAAVGASSTRVVMRRWARVMLFGTIIQRRHRMPVRYWRYFRSTKKTRCLLFCPFFRPSVWLSTSMCVSLSLIRSHPSLFAISTSSSVFLSRKGRLAVFMWSESEAIFSFRFRPCIVVAH